MSGVESVSTTTSSTVSRGVVGKDARIRRSRWMSARWDRSASTSDSNEAALRTDSREMLRSGWRGSDARRESGEEKMRSLGRD